MANDIGYGIRITADGTAAFVDNVKTSKAALRELGDEAERSGRAVANAQNAQASATNKMASEYRTAASSARTYAESTNKLDSEMARFLTSTDKAYRNQLLLDKGNDLLTRGLQAGLISQKAYDATLARLAERFGTTGKQASEHGHVIEGLGISAGFAARETRALVDELAAGRTNQALGTFTNITGRIAMVQPVAVLATLAVVAFGAGIAYAAAQSEKLGRAIADMQAGLRATGRAGIESDADLRQMVRTLSLLPDVSRESAEGIVSQFARTHQIGGDLFKRLVGIVGDFSKATGEEAPKAAAKLAQAFEDPFKGAKALDEELNILTPRQRELIDSFEKTHDVIAAQGVLYDALKDRIQGLQRDAMTPIERAAQQLKETWHSLTDTMRDSSAIQAVKDLYAGVLGVISTVIVKVQTFLDLHDRFFRAAVTLASGAGIGAAIAEASRSTRGSSDTTTGVSSADKESLDDQVKSAMKLGDAYQSAGEKMAELALKRSAVIQALGALEEAGRTNGAEFARLKQVYVDLGIAMAELARPVSQAQAAFASSTAKSAIEAQKGEIDRLIERNQFLYSNGLITAERYYDTIADLSRRQLGLQVQMIDAEIAAEQRAFGQAAKLQEQLPIAAKLYGLSLQRIEAEKQLGAVQDVRGQRAYAIAKAGFDYEVKITQQVADYLKKLKDQTAEDEFQLSLIGQTERAQKIATAERQVRLDAEAEINRLLRERATLEAKGPIDPAQAQAIENAIASIKSNLPGAVQSAGDLAGKISDAGQNAIALSTAFQAVDNAAFETFKRFKDGWRGAAQYAADQIKQYVVRLLYEITAQRWLIGIFGAGAAGANASPATAGANALLGSAGSSLAGSALSGAGSYLFGSEGVVSTAAFGSAGAGAFSAAAGAGFSAGVDTLGIAATAGAEAVGGFSAVVGAAIPVIGWIVLIGAALYAIFGSKGGAKKVGGSFLGNYTGTGGFVSDVTSTLDRSHYLHDETRQDADARKAGDVIAEAVAASIARLGGTSSGFQVGVGWNRDTAGDAPSMVGTVARDASGNVLFSTDNRNVSRDDGAIEAEIQRQSEQVIVAILQHSNLSATIKKVIDSIDVNSSKEKIEGMLQLAQAFHDILALGSRDAVADAQEAYKAASRTALETVRAQGTALVDLANKFDGSAAMTQTLAQAQQTYRASLISLLASIEQVKGELADMFGQTREKIARSGLTDDQLYQRLQDQAGQKFGELQSATDPAQAQRLAKELDSLYNQAFDMLSPEQQQALKGQYLANLDVLDKTANQKLTELAAAIAEESKKPFEVVATKLDEAADKMLAAAQKISDAADAIVSAGGGGGGAGDTVVVFPRSPAPEAGV
jgi:hypothetical protein